MRGMRLSPSCSARLPLRPPLAGIVVLVLIAVALLAPLIAPHSPVEQYRDFVKIPPAWLDGGNWKFILGTDEAGRDILSRLMFGARMSFWIGFVSVVLALIPGIVLGLVAAFFQKWADTPVMRIMDVLLALPSLLLAVAVVATMYGTVLANAVAGPMGDKLATRSGEEILSKEMMLQGILSIQAGDNPRATQEKMLAFIPNTVRRNLKLAA